MKKNILFTGIFTGILMIAFYAGYKVTMHADKNLPVYENTSSYPEYSFAELVDESDVIISAEVINVGDSFMKSVPVSLTENPDDATEELSYPVTPVTLRVNTSIKGQMTSDEFVYYEDGGITDTYIVETAGYTMEEGYSVLLFLNDAGYGWGQQSIYPIVDDSVILNDAAIDYMQGECITVEATAAINSNIRSQINSTEVQVMSVNDFISVVQEIIE